MSKSAEKTLKDYGSDLPLVSEDVIHEEGSVADAADGSQVGVLDESGPTKLIVDDHTMAHMGQNSYARGTRTYEAKGRMVQVTVDESSQEILDSNEASYELHPDEAIAEIEDILAKNKQFP